MFGKKSASRINIMLKARFDNNAILIAIKETCLMGLLRKTIVLRLNRSIL